jgi:hypothetical protein
MAETNDILEVAKMTISTSIKCNTVRGFIGWHSCDNICMDMHDVLDMCEDAFKRERYQESLEADTYVLVSGVKLASCADSSSGMLTDVIMRAFELIDLSTQTIAKLDAAMRKHALSLIIKEAKKKRLTAGTRGAMNYWKRLFVCVMRSWQQNWKSFWIYS